MNAFAINHAAPAAPWAGFVPLMRIAKKWNDRRITRRELSRLDDHILRDIGMLPRERDPGAELLSKARASW